MLSITESFISLSSVFAHFFMAFILDFCTRFGITPTAMVAFSACVGEFGMWSVFVFAVSACVCMHTTQEDGLCSALLLPVYILKTGSLTEPRVKLAASQPQWPSALDPQWSRGHQ